MPNKGEDGEVNIIKHLYIHRNDRSWVFKYFGYDSRIALMHPKHYDDWATYGITRFIEHEGDIHKAGGSYKADIILVFLDVYIIKRVSIKCFDGGAPTIMNHTPRTAKCWNETLEPPDAIVAKMNQLRSSGVCGEDIHLPRLHLDDQEMKNLKKILTHFVSIGSGSRKSKVPCDSVLYAKDDEVTQFYSSISEYIDTLITSQKLVLSMRSKGYTGKKSLEDDTWVYQEPYGKPKGALNIRLRT
jgi:hypothetical protein